MNDDRNDLTDLVDLPVDVDVPAVDYVESTVYNAPPVYDYDYPEEVPPPPPSDD